MKEGYEKYCRNGICDSKSRPKRYKMDEHRHEDPKDKCWYSGCQCPGERLIIPKEEIKLEDVFNEEKRERIKELIKKRKLASMMRDDEELGLYEEPHNLLPGFINQFEEGGEYQELTNEDWSVSQFLKWLKSNNFKIIK